MKKVFKVGESPIYMEIKGTLGLKGKFKGIYATYDRQITGEEIVGTANLQENGCS